MSRLTRLLRAMDPRVLERNAARLDSLRESTKSLRQELHALQEGLAGLTTQLGLVHVQIEQLVALRREELDTPARMDRLESTLRADRVHTHVRAAVARGELAGHPVAHLRISELLPADVYAAALDAIPPNVFFDSGAPHGEELRVPPTLAPAYSIATWTFLAEMVDRALGPALVERFQDPLNRHIRTLGSSLDARDLQMTVRPGRLVLRRPGVDASSSRTRPWHFLTTIVDLARADDSEDYGSVLSGPESVTGVPTTIPFRPNSALTVFNPAGLHRYVTIPSTAAATARHTYEFRIGPDKATRRRLISRMDQAERRAWDASE